MASIDYKWRWVKRDDAGYITEAAVAFRVVSYEEQAVDGKAQTVFTSVAKISPTAAAVKDLGIDRAWTGCNGEDKAVVFKWASPSIKSDDELRKFCNAKAASCASVAKTEAAPWAKDAEGVKA